MTARSPSAFLMSASMHGAVAIVLLLMSYVLKPQGDKAPKVFELVAGEGDNYMATEAPALGTPGGAKVSVPEAPAPKIERAPVQRAPEPVVQRATPKPAETIPDLSKSVKRIATKRETRIVTKYRKELEAERKAEERRAKEEELRSKRMTKEEFDRLNKSGVRTPQNSRTTKVAHIDAEGIAKGVIGGSTANKVGGAGGTALTRDEGDAIDAYIALLVQKIQAELNEQPGTGTAGLTIEVELRITLDGELRNVEIAKRSESRDFDDVVLKALAKIRMPARPPGLTDVLRIPIHTKED